MNRTLLITSMCALLGIGVSSIPSYAEARQRVDQHPASVTLIKGESHEGGRLDPRGLKRSEGSSISPSRASQESSVALMTIVDENFSKWSEGDEANPIDINDIDGFVTDPADPFYISQERTAQHPWSGEGIMSAGGVAGLCTPGYGGWIQTPPADYSGEVHLTFRLKMSPQAADTEGEMNVIFCKGRPENGSYLDTKNGIKYFSVEKDGEWHEFEYVYDNRYAGDDCFIQFNTYEEMLLDDVKIEARTTFLAHPKLLPATDYTDTGFRANWVANNKATDYLLTVYCMHGVTDDEYVNYSEDFAKLNVTDNRINTEHGLTPGWEFALSDGSSDEIYSDGEAKSLRFDSEGDCVALPSNGGKYMNFSMHLKYMAGQYNLHELYPEYYEEDYWEYPGKIRVEGWDGYKWVNICAFSFNEELADCTRTVPSYLLNGIFKLRLISDTFYEEPVEIALQQVSWTTTTPAEQQFYCVDRVVTDNYCVISDLKRDEDYYYYVRSRNTELGMDSGEPTEAMFAFGVPTPSGLNATDVTENGYTAQWDAVAKATGYTVANYRVTTADEAGETVVLNETFSPIPDEGTFDTPVEYEPSVSLVRIDALTDNPGWYGFLVGYADGGLDLIGYPEGGYGAQLQTPELSLGHGDGSVTIEIEAKGDFGTYLVVQNSAKQSISALLDSDFEKFQGTLPLCQDNDIITFYTDNSYPCVIKSIKITQNLEAGDKIFSFISDEHTKDNSLTIKDLDKDCQYAFSLYSTYTKFGQTAYSVTSPKYIVPSVNGISHAKVDKNISIKREGDEIVIEAPEGQQVIVSDIAGCVIEKSTLKNGIMRVIPGCSGVYIIKVGNTVKKVTI